MATRTYDPQRARTLRRVQACPEIHGIHDERDGIVCEVCGYGARPSRLLPLHPLARATLYVVLFWYAHDIVTTWIWRLAVPAQ